MVRLQEFQRAGINRYDQMVKYYNENGLNLCFETKHATILVLEHEVNGALPDCLVFVDIAGAAPSLDKLPGSWRGKQIIYAVNKMYVGGALGGKNG